MHFIFSNIFSSDEIAGHLQSEQNEPGRHHHDICSVGVFPKAGRLAPIAHDNQDHGERQQLADFDTDVERKQVREETVLRVSRCP
jgi:hypothetical protein